MVHFGNGLDQNGIGSRDVEWAVPFGPALLNCYFEAAAGGGEIKER